jgi:hypothetical protein
LGIVASLILFARLLRCAANTGAATVVAINSTATMRVPVAIMRKFISLKYAPYDFLYVIFLCSKNLLHFCRVIMVGDCHPT